MTRYRGILEDEAHHFYAKYFDCVPVKEDLIAFHSHRRAGKLPQNVSLYGDEIEKIKSYFGPGTSFDTAGLAAGEYSPSRNMHVWNNNAPDKYEIGGPR